MSGVVVKVKVCGVTRVADALAAAAAGADAVGLNFWRPGRRCVSAARAQEIVAALLAAHPRVLPVAVFVDAPLDEVEHTLVSTGCRAAQLHGDEPPALVAALGARAWKVLRHGGPPGAGAGAAAADIEARARTFPGVTLLVDTAGAALPGGTGVASGASCAAVRRLRAGGREVWLAGGLTPANVGAAIAACAPSGVDVASGVETAPGVKDEALVRAFVAAVRVAASPPA